MANMQVAEFNKSGLRKKKGKQVQRVTLSGKQQALNVRRVVAIIHNARLAEKKGGFANKSNR